MDNKEKETHTCPICGYRYDDQSWAEKCETWCREHQSCNIEIIAHGMPPEPAESV